MRALAQRIERATRDYFITHEEGNSDYAPETWADREKIWERIQELKTEKSLGYHEARQMAVAEWIFQVLEEQCVRTSYKNLKPKRQSVLPVAVKINDTADNDEGADDWDCDLPTEKKETVRPATKEKPVAVLEEQDEVVAVLDKPVRTVRKHTPVLPEEELD